MLYLTGKNLSYEYPHCGVVATADAATYQLIKISAIHFDEQYQPENGMAHAIGSTDNSGRLPYQVLQILYFIYPSCLLLDKASLFSRFLFLRLYR
jgi:hypothetical protein